LKFAERMLARVAAWVKREDERTLARIRKAKRSELSDWLRSVEWEDNDPVLSRYLAPDPDELPSDRPRALLLGRTK
jgi:hypothetical protein